MGKPKFFVTGATGKMGSAVVDQLLAKGYPVRASVRKQDARSANLERPGVDRALGFPMPPNPSFSIEDERWHREHSQMMARQPRMASPWRPVLAEAGRR